MTHISPLVHPFFCHIVHHGAKISANVEVTVGIEDSEDQAALLVTGKLHQIASTLADLSELGCIGDGAQRTVRFKAPPVIGTTE